jgi:hypothetical protein
VTNLEWTAWALVVLVAAIITLWVVWAAASRLDRLHRRVRESRATLDAQLVRRATAAWDLATADVLDPPSAALVVAAARAALARSGADSLPAGENAAGDADEPDQAMVESELSRVLRAALGDADRRARLAERDGARDLIENLDRAWYRVQLARRFHNDAVVQVRRIRAKGYVRLFRLAGQAPMPQTFEMDDATGVG